MNDLRAAVARADEVLGCAGTCRFKTPTGQSTNGRCDCLERPRATMALAALYKATKALVATEEPRERWVDAEGVTRLPRAMREELGVGDGAYIWFLRGPERWEAWRESELCEILGATSHDNACSGSNDPGQDGSKK